MKFAWFMLLALASVDAMAVSPCYQEPGTRSMMCIDGTHIRSNGSLRSSKLYTGGPNGVESTTYIVIADCDKKIMTLQDKQGVNFGGGGFDSKPASAAISQWLCEAKKTTPDKRLVMF